MTSVLDTRVLTLNDKLRVIAWLYPDKIGNEMEMKAVCSRCDTPVEFDEVSPGYWAVCPSHDEDLFMIECKVEVTA
jgi:hypothetical protein